MNYGLNNCWTTPILYDKIDNLDVMSKTIDYILTNIDLNIPPSDFQEFDILKDSGEVMREFKELVVIPTFQKYIKQLGIEECKSYSIKSWLAGPNAGYVIPVHNHSGAAISAVFYLLCEDTSSGGELYFQDPRANANRGYTKSFSKLFQNQSILPSSGDIVMFPSYVYHYTNPFHGKLRLAIPVDFFPKN
jgi:hypothetical protein